MKNSLMAIATSGLLCVSAASAAQTPETNTAAAEPTKPAKEQKYCLSPGTDTGSNLKRVECRTKKEWRSLGVDLGDDVK